MFPYSRTFLVGTPLRLRMTCPPGARSRTVRSFQQGRAVAWPRKDSQDKDSINTEATEYSKSGTDDQAAGETDAAYNPNQTAPDAEKATAGADKKDSSNPLDVSPANPEVSKPRGSQEGGPENQEKSRDRASGSGSPQKNKSG